MSDLLQASVWAAVLGAGGVACVMLHRLGLGTTYVRDLLHVGAGVWVLGWRYWRGPAWPTAITAAAAIAIWVVPRVPALAPFRRAVADPEPPAGSGGGERWAGLGLYTLAFAVFTFLGVTGHPSQAAAALWALTLGDGIGGLVGRRFGRNHFSIPGGKQKSFEGSIAVAVFAGLGAWLAAWWFGGEPHVLAVAFTAAIAEALAPRSTDNLVLPVAVYAVLRGLS